MTALVVALALTFTASAGDRPATGGDPCAVPPSWSHWSRYVQAFVSGDGRVIDRTAHDRTTSEGQAYALFFSLVANDRQLFDRIVRWTEANLASGDLSRTLPAWEWGRRPDGSWGVLDSNSASDADLWLAYALFEAGRLWTVPRYDAIARSILDNVARHEVANLPGLGPTLLPAPRGFAVEDGRAWRLNPSYVPPQLLRRAATLAPRGPWGEVLTSSLRLLRDASPRGVVADWVLYSPGEGFARDPVSGGIGSYDAIRVYLWVGMLPASDPARGGLRQSTSGLLRVLESRNGLPERIDAASLRAEGAAPVGFYAALLPLAKSSAPSVVAELDGRVSSAAHDGLYGNPPAYFDQNLILFARGFLEGRFQFMADGRLEPAWGRACAPPRS